MYSASDVPYGRISQFISQINEVRRFTNQNESFKWCDNFATIAGFRNDDAGALVAPASKNRGIGVCYQ